MRLYNAPPYPKVYEMLAEAKAYAVPGDSVVLLINHSPRTVREYKAVVPAAKRALDWPESIPVRVARRWSSYPYFWVMRMAMTLWPDYVTVEGG